MPIVVIMPVLLLILGAVIFLMVKLSSSIKIMLFGLHLSLVGGIMVIDPNSGLSGLGYFIILVGLVVSVIGADKK
ncbi:hypothetical protein [Alkalihalobacillus sp. AL-G]|uniref:hypothetical protein n=1 Tax=Alkalihalobacillus sp. AL-G TaxID=2926399 RepID=UPI00272D3345|nr:hypothetical protein [Alkalihalobacillus sp. AL-G]WLD94348.1 hypothetical protein MOJ78_05520 [Alkalihalobacillus sp. AL-G]